MCQHCQGIRTKEQSSTWLNPAEIKTMGFQWRGELATWEKNNSGRLWRSQVAMAGSKKGSEMVRRSNRRGHVCATGLWSFYRMTETENKDLLMKNKKEKKSLVMILVMVITLVMSVLSAGVRDQWMAVFIMEKWEFRALSHQGTKIKRRWDWATNTPTLMRENPLLSFSVSELWPFDKSQEPKIWN